MLITTVTFYLSTHSRDRNSLLPSVGGCRLRSADHLLRALAQFARGFLDLLPEIASDLSRFGCGLLRRLLQLLHTRKRLTELFQAMAQLPAPLIAHGQCYGYSKECTEHQAHEDALPTIHVSASFPDKHPCFLREWLPGMSFSPVLQSRQVWRT